MVVNSFLWDTCVVYRWFNGVPAEYVDHIERFLEEASSKKCEIYISTVTLAEIAPSKMKKTGLNPSQVLASMSKSFIIVDTSPDIMSLAGHLRDQQYRHIDGPDDKAATRHLSLGDSIHLATAVALREEFGVQSLGLHTFDEGKKRDGETGKKTVPIIGFHNWCRNCADDEEVQKVISLAKTKPVHPQCPLPKKNPKSNDSKKPPAIWKRTTTKSGSTRN